MKPMRSCESLGVGIGEMSLHMVGLVNIFIYSKTKQEF